jgi:hypothetical protein
MLIAAGAHEAHAYRYSVMRGTIMGTSWVYGERDYKAIEEALRRSPYGRWFLEEYLVRNRSEETERLLDALTRLESSLEARAAADQLPRLSEISGEIEAALEDTLNHLDEPHGQRTAAEEPPADTILEAVEDINGFLESLNTRKVHKRLPEKIRGRLADIQAACALVDAQSGAAASLSAVLSDLKRRLAAMGAEWMASGTLAADSGGSDVGFRRQLFDELSDALANDGRAPAPRSGV